jgi:WD40 repeat protein
MVWLPDSRGLIVGGEKLIAVCELAEVLGATESKPKSRGEPLSLAGHQEKVEGLSYSPDGRTLLSWDRYHVWRVWDLSGGAGQAKDVTPSPRPSFYDPDVVSWSPDGSRLALSTSTGRHSVQWLGDLKTWERKAIVMNGLRFSHLAFTPGGRLFLGLASGDLAQCWARFELRDGDGETVLFANQIDLPNSDGLVTRSAASLDDRCIYAAVGRNGVYRWAPETGEVARVLAQGSLGTHLSLRQDGRRALTAGGNTAYLWSLPDGKRLLELKHPLQCSGAALLPGERIVTASYDGVVRVWDATGGSQLHALDLGMGKVYCLAVSPDHMTFAAGVHRKNRIVLMDVPE